jgi:MFS family permease
MRPIESGTMKRNVVTQVLALGVTQTLAWAASTYLIAILARPIADELGLQVSTVYGAFSVALIVMAIAAPAAGRMIDRHGGRGVLALSNVVLACGLVMLGAAPNPTVLYIAWCVLGVGMALGLYDAAFATLVKLHAGEARAPITGITLIAGFASTVGWPVTAFIAEQYGWRASCFAWAASQIIIALPLNLLFIPAARRASGLPETAVQQDEQHDDAPHRTRADYRRAFFLVALFGGTTAFVTSAMAAHLPGLLLAVGTGKVAAVAAAALLGPAQVAARFLEFLASRRFRFHPLLTARLATVAHPIGGVVLGIAGGPAYVASAFAVLHGAGNGMITIAKGTLPLAIFGAAGYGERQGLLNILGRGMQAVAPFAFGVVLDRFGATSALALSVTLSLIALAALLALRTTPSSRADPTR